jgi:outer membrane protein OmpA-like peptidoglycan-associated protein
MRSMSSSTAPDSPKAADEDLPSLTEEHLVELRRLLLGPWQTEVSRLKQRLDDPGLHARDVGGVLPEAVVMRSGQDEKLATALTPTVEEILKASVKKDPKTLVDALFPVMGPAIRKAILETVKRMIQSFDQIIGQSFSWRGLKWRVEAFRTGKSFGEVALFHSLLYRVEQIFLIHRETGLLLQHVVAESATAQEPDMVSGMLTAIQDFIHDSFRTEGEDTLDAVQMGELTLWIEQGPLAVIAGVIRGNPPERLRQFFAEALESIHLEQYQSLETFKGDAAPFEAVRHYLESCLWAQYKPGKKKVSPLTVVILGALAAVLGWWGVHAIQSNLRWAAYVEKLGAEPGVVIIETGKREGQRFISGLRDPLAKDPADLLKEAGIDPKEVVFRWEPYYALNDRFILTRARQLLNPPETVSLTFEDGVLTAEGSAPHQWVHEVRGRLAAIPGMVQFRDKNLVDRDLEELAAVKERLEQTVLFFETNTPRLLPDQSGRVGDLVEQIRRFQLLAMVVGVGSRIQVVGHADASGLETENIKLSQKRADEIRALLVSRGIDPGLLHAVGMGTTRPVRKEFSEQDRGFNRSVTFKLKLREAIEQKS